MNEHLEKLKDVESDYFSALAKFSNIETLYINNKEDFEINELDTEEVKRIKESKVKELLVDLGRVGELAFKYIIKLEQLDKYPSQSFEEFNRSSLFKRSPLRSYALNIHHKEESEIEELLNYHDPNNQNAHNFDYLFRIIDTLMENVTSKFYKIIEYSLLSKELLAHPLYNYNKFEYEYESIVFPEYILNKKRTCVEEERERLIELRKNTISETC